MIILLAAGLSRRFGSANKLLAPYDSKPLISHVVNTLSALPVGRRIAAIGSDVDPDFLKGFDTVVPRGDDALQSHSLKTAMAMAMENQPDAVLICLADMPLVPKYHFEQLCACLDGPATLVATQSQQRFIPPALIGQQWFKALLAIEGDRGARDIIGQAKSVVPLAEDLAVDIDTVTDLLRLHSLAL